MWPGVNDMNHFQNHVVTKESDSISFPKKMTKHDCNSSVHEGHSSWKIRTSSATAPKTQILLVL